MEQDDQKHDVECWSDDTQDIDKWMAEHNEFLKAYRTTSTEENNFKQVNQILNATNP